MRVGPHDVFGERTPRAAIGILPESVREFHEPKVAKLLKRRTLAPDWMTPFGSLAVGKLDDSHHGHVDLVDLGPKQLPLPLPEPDAIHEGVKPLTKGVLARMEGRGRTRREDEEKQRDEHLDDATLYAARGVVGLQRDGGYLTWPGRARFVVKTAHSVANLPKSKPFRGSGQRGGQGQTSQRPRAPREPCRPTRFRHIIVRHVRYRTTVRSTLRATAVHFAHRQHLQPT